LFSTCHVSLFSDIGLVLHGGEEKPQPLNLVIYDRTKTNFWNVRVSSTIVRIS